MGNTDARDGGIGRAHLGRGGFTEERRVRIRCAISDHDQQVFPVILIMLAGQGFNLLGGVVVQCLLVGVGRRAALHVIGDQLLQVRVRLYPHWHDDHREEVREFPGKLMTLGFEYAGGQVLARPETIDGTDGSPYRTAGFFREAVHGLKYRFHNPLPNGKGCGIFEFDKSSHGG